MKSRDVTRMLNRWSGGDSEALNELMPLVHDEILVLALSCLRGQRSRLTLEPRALVNETFLKMVVARPSSWKNRAHFFAYLLTTMRRILINRNRHRETQKMGGDAIPAALEDSFYSSIQYGADASESERSRNHGFNVDVFALKLALQKLTKLDHRQSRIVELHYFGGLTVPEIAQIFKTSSRTVKRELHTARLWLNHALAAPG